MNSVKATRKSEAPLLVLPRLYTLQEAAEAFGTAGVTVGALRKEVQAGRLHTVRLSDAKNAKYFIEEAELLRWLREVAATRPVGSADREERKVRHGR